MYTIMLSANNDSFISFFPIWMPFISLSCLITKFRTSKTMLNRSGESRNPCLLHNLSGEDFSFCLWGMMLVVGFSYMAFIVLNMLSLLPLYWVFYHKWVLYLTKCFFCIYWYDHVIFVFCFVYVMYYAYWFANIIPFLHPWDESHLIMVYDLFNALLELDCQYIFFWGF